MSDDTFIREVNEEMRHERVHAIWRRYGKLIIGLAVLAVLATIAFVVWERYRAAEAAADGDRYFAAVDLARAGDTQGAIAAMEGLADDGVAAYPHLARLRIASTLAASGDGSGAVEALDAVAASSAPQALRDVAAVRAAYILVDDGTPDDVRQRVERLTNEAEPLRHPAREALGLSLWKAGEGEAAGGFFQQITEDLSAPSGISQRARLMLEIIDSGTAPPTPGAAPAPSTTTISAVPPVSPAAAATTTQASAADAPVVAPADGPPADATPPAPIAEQPDLPVPGNAVGGVPPVEAPSAEEPATSPQPPTAPAPEQIPGATPPS